VPTRQTYEQVCSGRTGHTEAVQLEYQPAAVSYADLLDVFWDRIDPTMRGGQGADIGTQYRAGIYCHTEEQKQIADASMKAEQAKHIKEIATEVEMLNVFYPAEQYHQQYLANGGQCSRKGDLSPIRCYG
jgi:peptide-methionine (S)-S-oxide reductase